MIAETAVRFNPFPGLRSFEADEEHLFFGRERQIDELLARLRKTRFLAVVGTSGSGKSSLVRSGLIPALHGGFMTRAGSSWRVAVFRPGDDPIGNLAEALGSRQVLGCDPEIADLHRTLIDTTLHRSARGLAESVRLARIPEHDNVLVLVDQFEELFRFKRNPRIKDSHEEAAAFIRLLLEASRQSEVPVYVVLTMRSDFIGNCTELPGLAEAVNNGQFLVPRMTREERRAAIVGPVAVGGADIAPRLVLRLLNDVGDDLDQLPILQHALMRTWDRWEADHAPHETLDLRHFEAAGTLREALSLHAEEAYRGLAGDRQREIAAVVFKALTERGLDNRGVRRPTRLADVCALAGASEDEVIAVVDGFRMPGRSFLMPPWGTPLDADTVLDISHESLMRIWERLIQWVDEEGRSAQLYVRLSKAAAQYQEGSGGLWRDPELQLALNWREEAQPSSLWAQRYDPAFERAMLFLDHSRKERDHYIERRERDRRRQLLRARWMMVVFGAAALCTLVFGLSTLTLKVKADAAMHEAQAQAQLAEQHEKEAHRQRENAERRKQELEVETSKAEQSRRLAEAESVRAERQQAEAEAQRQKADVARRDAEAASRRAEEARRATETQRTIALEARDRAEASRTQAEKAKAEADRLALQQTARALALQSTRLPQDQRELAGLLALQAYRFHQRSGGEPGDKDQFAALRQALARLDPAHEIVLRQNKDAVRALALTADGRTLASGGDDGAVRLFDLRRPGGEPQTLIPSGDSIRSLAIDPAGRWLAAGGFSGALRLWDLRQVQSPPQVVTRSTAPVSALAFGGSRLAIGSADQVELLSPERPGEAARLTSGTGHRISALAFSADGALLAAGSAGGGVLLWDLRAAGQAQRTLGSGVDVRAVAFGRDGLLFAGTAKGTILVWSLDGSRDGAGGPPAEMTAHTAPVTGLAARGGLLASASLDGSVRLWDLAHRDREPIALRDHAGWVWALALSPDGDRVVSGGADRTIRIRPTHAEQLADLLCSKLSRNLTREEWSAAIPGVPYEATCPALER